MKSLQGVLRILTGLLFSKFV